ncbi:hypothetical protein BGX31_010285 [Mortierella sp. GBA43]|nr:hypothetical protein BGX31_010285 [Mortierella sp. GBA43]
MVGCFQNQPDSSVGSSAKSYQDIFMSQGACTNFCKSNGSAYAITSEGSTCRCSNSPPLDANKVDMAKCDKPCMGYPFEMCGGTSGHGLANVLLIGSTANIPATTGGEGSSSSVVPSPSTAPDGDDKTKNNPEAVNGGKALNVNSSPGMLLPPGPTATGIHDYKEREKKKNEYGNENENENQNTNENWKKENGQNVTTRVPTDEDNQASSSGSSAGAIAASILAVFAFGTLFAVAVVFSKRRRQRLAQAAWTENMLLPSSLIHTSNDDELEGQDYTRATPIYKNNTQQGPMHFPPPPALHPRQNGALHQSGFPPPMMTPHYGGSSMQAPYHSYPLPPMMIAQGYEHADINHKEPLSPSFSRAPQSLQQALPMEAMEEEDQEERIISRPSMRSIRQDRQGVQRSSVDSSASVLRAPSIDNSYRGSEC